MRANSHYAIAMIFFGLLASLTYKFLGMRLHKELFYVETSLTFVFPWSAYYICEALELSGIVGIMMAGIVMSLFMRESLSDEAEGPHALISNEGDVYDILLTNFGFDGCHLVWLQSPVNDMDEGALHSHH